MLARPLFYLMISLILLCALLAGVARVWGSAHPSAYIAFQTIYYGNGNLYVLDVARGIRLHISPIAPYPLLAWSTDGRLMFPSEHSDNPEIYIWDGVDVINVSNNPAWDIHPSLSADGRLALASDRSGNSEIYIWDGIALTNITNSQDYEYYPLWWTP
jgi:Tol biopolymer transport system component